MIASCQPLYDGDKRATCGAVYNDETHSTLCPHYPIGTSAESFCKRCDLYRPCVCDTTKRD